MIFLKFWKLFGNSSEVFGNLRKFFGKFPNVIGNVRNGSQELKSLRSPRMDATKLLRASNDGIVKWNTTRCIPQNMQR